MLMTSGEYNYSYKLWFETESGSGSVLTLRDSVSPGVKTPINSEFYVRLQQKYFSSIPKVKCYELYALYLGVLPLKVVERHNQLLIKLLLPSTRENM